MLNRIQRMVVLGAAFALVLSVGPVGPVAAASPVLHAGSSVHREVELVYYPDDICGPRSGWSEVVTTVQWKYTERPDGTFNNVYVETGTYHTDFDDSTIPSYDSQFTGAQHATITRGGTQISTFEWHDFPGSITIREHVTFVQVRDEVRVDRDDLHVDGCP
jgi:hypothetical protein